MPAIDYQIIIQKKLQKYFEEVKIEWSISKEAKDIFKYEKGTYGPRLDVAVGSFNLIEGNQKYEIRKCFLNNAPNKLKKMLKGLKMNNNPRCCLAIEVVNSGSSKHVIGDITNASMLGLYGIVVANEKNIEKVKRIFKYIEKIKEVKKSPLELFKNVIIVTEKEFIEIIK